MEEFEIELVNLTYMWGWGAILVVFAVACVWLLGQIPGRKQPPDC